MDIFESLENLNVSEECFEDIVRLVEELLSEKYEVTNSLPIKQGSYVVTAPKYSEKYIPGKLYTSQQRTNMKNSAQNAKAQELADAANREGKTPQEIANKRGYDKGVLTPTLKTPDEIVKSAKHRKGMKS